LMASGRVPMATRILAALKAVSPGKQTKAAAKIRSGFCLHTEWDQQ